MKQKTRFAIVASACILSMAASGALAAYDATASVTNNLSLDTVDISLSEYSIENGEEVPYSNDYTDLMPGTVVSKIPRITNLGADCYTRAKIEIEYISAQGEELESKALTIDDIEGIDLTKWTLKEDGYYYLNDILETSEKEDLFKSVTVPDDWVNPNENCSFNIAITVEAVQSENFTPDMDSESPWGDTEIETCIRTRDFRELKDSDDKQFVMYYSDGTKELIVEEDDLFSNFASMVPGDTAEDTLSIRNEGNADIELFFSTSYFNDYELAEDADLLKQIGLTIEVVNSDESLTVYTGDLMAQELQEAISIGTFEPGYEGELKFTLSVPETLQNEFNMTETKVQWNFGLEDLGTGAGVPASPSEETKKSDADTNPHTGTTALKAASGILAVLSLSCLFSLIRKPKNKFRI